MASAETSGSGGGSRQPAHTAGGSDETTIIARKCFAGFWWQMRAGDDSPVESSAPTLTGLLPGGDLGVWLGGVEQGALGMKGSP